MSFALAALLLLIFAIPGLQSKKPRQPTERELEQRRIHVLEQRVAELEKLRGYR